MKPSHRNPPRNRGYFSRSPRAFSIEKYNISRSGYHSKFHAMLHLPRKVTLELHQILRLPRKVTLERHQILHPLRFSTLRYSTILFSTLRYSTRLESILRRIYSQTNLFSGESNLKRIYSQTNLTYESILLRI